MSGRPHRKRASAWPLLAIAGISAATLLAGHRYFFASVVNDQPDVINRDANAIKQAALDGNFVAKYAGTCGVYAQVEHDSWATQAALTASLCGSAAGCPGALLPRVPFHDVVPATWNSEQLLDLLNSCSMAAQTNSPAPPLVLRAYLLWTPTQPARRGLLRARQQQSGAQKLPASLFHAWTLVQQSTGGQWQLYQSFNHSYSLETHLTSKETGAAPLTTAQLQRLIEQLQILELHHKQWDSAADAALAALTGISLLQSHAGQTDEHRTQLLHMLGLSADDVASVTQQVPPAGEQEHCDLPMQQETAGDGASGGTAQHEGQDADSVDTATAGLEDSSEVRVAALPEQQPLRSGDASVTHPSRAGAPAPAVQWRLPLQLRWDVACVAKGPGPSRPSAASGSMAHRVRIVQGIGDAELRLWLHKWLVHRKDSYDIEH